MVSTIARRACLACAYSVALGVGCGRVGFESLGRGMGDGTADAGTGGATSADASSGGASDVDASTGGAPSASGGAPSQNGGTSNTAGGAASNGGADGGSRDAAPVVDAAADAAPDAGCTTLTVADYCAQIPALPAAPVIDGQIDCGLALRPLSPLGWMGSDGGPVDSRAEYAVAFRPDGLYFYVRIHDPTLVPPELTAEAWQGDGVEIYVDDDGTFAAAPAFDNPGSRQVQVTAPVDSATPSTRGELFTPGVALPRQAWSGPNFGAFPEADGYTVEAFVTAAELGIATWSLAPGARVGMDLSINVSFADPAFVDVSQGHREGQYFLNVATTGDPAAFNNVGAFCLPTLVGP